MVRLPNRPRKYLSSFSCNFAPLEQLNRKDSLSAMNKMFFVPFISIVLVALDYYVWMAVKTAFRNSRQSIQNTAKYTFWGFTVFILLGILSYNALPINAWKNEIRMTFMAIVMISVITKLFIIIFLLLEDITRFFRWGTKKVLKKDPSAISRHEFLSQAALAVGAVPAATFAFGIISGAHDYTVENIPLKIPQLPSAFKGLKIAQISDIHTGSFFNKTAVKGGVEMLMREKPDVVFFTGDLVNNESKEVQNYFDVFNKVKAPLGVFSTLGNHDYGDYVQWNEQDEKQANLTKLIRIHQSIGFQPLLNDAVELGDDCWLLGVENWGKAPFRQSGKLAETLSKVPADAFKILLSHDPSHFDAQVLDTDIDLTLSGHTHGMQFGIERFGIKFSPVSFKYPKWAGLYQVGKQYLYVNRGFGFLGFPGRVGIYPEITNFTLKKAEE